MTQNEKIEAYVKGQLSGPELMSFEEEMSKDDSLKKAVNLYRFENDTIDLMLRDTLKKEISGLRKYQQHNIKINPETKVRKLWFPISIAASVALVIGFFTFILTNNSNQSQDSALAFYSQYKPNFSSSRSTTDITDNTYDLLENGNKEEMPFVINSLKNQGESSSAYLLGHAFFIHENYKEAILSFNQYLKTEGGNLQKKEAAQFYLALSYLADGNKKLALEQCQTIIDTPNHPFGKMAEEVLQSN